MVKVAKRLTCTKLYYLAKFVGLVKIVNPPGPVELEKMHKLAKLVQLTNSLNLFDWRNEKTS